MAIESRNPATEEVVETFKPLTGAEIETALERADTAFAGHAGLKFSDRSTAMAKAAKILEDEKQEFGRLLTQEMGKTLASAIAEVEKCAWVCRYYADNAEGFMADEVLDSDAAKSFIRHLPLGPVLAVMPWNFPFWQVFRFAAPALMAGNVGLLKHASNVPRSALAIEDIFRRAGFIDGAFQTLLIGADAVAGVLKDRRVHAATLTGSEAAGAAVAAIAGKAIKKTVLELGGSDAFIVMPSADLAGAVDAAVTGRTINNGQSCIAAKRFIVHADIYDQFAKAFVARIEGLKVGDPMARDTDIGPLAMAQIRDDVAGQVEKSLKAGAKCLTGAEAVDGKGFFYRPGVLADIPESAPAFGEEVFGPVALLFKVKNLEEAIDLANATRFGLGSAIWTSEAGEIERAATGIRAGATFANAIVASDPRLPFGGVGASGYGRELSYLGIHEFVNRKTISIA